MTEPGTDAPRESAPACPWCGVAAVPDATRCSACGAALAQRESIGDLRIPGLTDVDPALEDFDNRPLHLRGPSPSQGAAPALIMGAVAGGPVGLAAIGGVAALAAVEFLGAKDDGPEGQALEDVGKPSEAVLLALEHLDERDAGSGPATGAGRPNAAGDGMAVWRDLPPGTDGP